MVILSNVESGGLFQKLAQLRSAKFRDTRRSCCVVFQFFEAREPTQRDGHPGRHAGWDDELRIFLATHSISRQDQKGMYILLYESDIERNPLVTPPTPRCPDPLVKSKLDLLGIVMM